jgi:antitoxin CptB
MRVKNAVHSWGCTIMAEENSAGEEITMRRRRLRYRAWHRGTKEMDLILGPYCDAYLECFAGEELDRLEALMEEPDTDLLRWVLGEDIPPPHIDQAMILSMRSFRLTGDGQ